MTDIHNYQRRTEQSLSRLNNSDLLEVNKKYILDFYRSCIMDGIGYGKISRYLDDLRKIARFINKDLNTAKREDIENLVLDFEKQPYSNWTKYGFRIVVRKFFKWLKKSDKLPEEVNWIKLKMKNSQNKLPEELLTEREIVSMIECAEDKRDKAFISLLYESGCRISELLTIKVKNIQFDDYGAKIAVFGKTGSRRVRIISSIVYLQPWLNNHPDKNNPEAFVWLKNRSKSELIGYNRIKILGD